MTPRRPSIFASLLTLSCLACVPSALQAQNNPAWWSQVPGLWDGIPTDQIADWELYAMTQSVIQMLDTKLAPIGGSGTTIQTLTGLLTVPGDPIVMSGQYFNSPDLSGPVAAYTQEVVNLGGSNFPPPGVSSNFSATWTGAVIAPRDGLYPIGFLAQGAARLWINGNLVLDHWNDPIYSDQAMLTLTAGTQLAIQIDYASDDSQPSVALGLATQPGLWAENGGQPFQDLDPDFNSSPAFRWTGITPSITFSISADNGWNSWMKVWVDDSPIYDSTIQDPGSNIYAYVSGWGGCTFRMETGNISQFSGGIGPSSFTSLSTDTSYNPYAGPVLQGTYYSNQDFSGSPALVRNELVDIYWGGESADYAILGTNDFSVQWTGSINVPADDEYVFVGDTSGNMSISIDGVPLNFTPDIYNSYLSYSDPTQLGGGAHSIEIDLVAGQFSWIHWTVCPADNIQIPAWWSNEPADFHAPLVIPALGGSPVTSATPATLGQLRAIVSLFRNRLSALGYLNFPSDVEGADSDPVTVADLQTLFNFDPDEVVNPQGQTFAQVVDAGGDPNATYYGSTPPILTALEGEDQTGPPGAFLPKPLTMKVTDANGHFYVHAPVTFALPPDDPGFLSVTGDGLSPLLKKITVVTDEQGLAWIYIKQ